MAPTQRIWVSPRFSELLGYPLQDLLDASCKLLTALHPDRVGSLRETIE